IESRPTGSVSSPKGSVPPGWGGIVVVVAADALLLWSSFSELPHAAASNPTTTRTVSPPNRRVLALFTKYPLDFPHAESRRSLKRAIIYTTGGEPHVSRATRRLSTELRGA